MSRGRRPSGPEYVAKLQGSDQSKKRLQMILKTMTGKLSLQDACRQLDISLIRFHQLRTQALQGALDHLEPRPPGRPGPQATPAGKQIQALEKALAQKELELQEAQVREEVALILPHVVNGATGPEKKTRLPPQKRRRRRRRP